MKIYRLVSSLQQAIQRLAVLLVSLVVLWGLAPSVALAAPVNPVSSQLVALAASSRFAAPSDEELEIQKMSEKRREELREQRRHWQEEASASAYDEAEALAESEESAKDKLNLDEIAEENPITN